MGIRLGDLVNPQDIKLKDLNGRVIAIDAFNFLYQFLATIRGPGGEPLKDREGRVTSHLSGLFYRTINLLEAGVKPVYVFDGKPPKFKAVEGARRREVREKAAKAWKEALAKGELEEARKAAARSTKITTEMIDDAKDLLHAMGIPAIQAPSEGEALAAAMCKEGDAWGVASQDFDTLLFGAPRLIRNLGMAGRKRYMRGEYVLVNPEIIELRKMLKDVELNRTQLIILGILVGTDFNPGGIPGYGPKKALKLAKESKNLKQALEVTGWPFDVAAEEVFDFFMNPPTDHYKIEFKTLNEKKVAKVLVEKHDFSAERILTALERIPKNKGSLADFAKK